MDKNTFKNKRRARRKHRIRQRVFGDAARPRLTVFRSLRHVYAQIIDDEHGLTLAAASTQQKNLGAPGKNNGNKKAAAAVGQAIAHKAVAVGIRQVRFDRNGYKFHGAVQALAQAAREAGLVL